MRINQRDQQLVKILNKSDEEKKVKSDKIFNGLLYITLNIVLIGIGLILMVGYLFKYIPTCIIPIIYFGALFIMYDIISKKSESS